jgi:hypothetical protein
MTMHRATDGPGPGAPDAAVVAATPEAWETNRFERDREQAMAVTAVVAIPILAFGIIDAMVAKSLLRLAVLWSIRGITIAGLTYLWYGLRRASSRARLEGLLFNAQLIGVALAVGAHVSRGQASLFMTRFELLSVVIYYLMIPGRTRQQAVPAIALSVASLAMVLLWHVDVSGPDLVSHVVCFVLANVLGWLVASHRQATAAAEQDAWRALAAAHARLQRTIDELRALRGVVPICPSCRKVRGARDAWQQLEAFVAERGDVRFSSILCPSCLQSEFGAVLTNQG